MLKQCKTTMLARCMGTLACASNPVAPTFQIFRCDDIFSKATSESFIARGGPLGAVMRTSVTSPIPLVLVAITVNSCATKSKLVLMPVPKKVWCAMLLSTGLKNTMQLPWLLTCGKEPHPPLRSWQLPPTTRATPSSVSSSSCGFASPPP